MRDWGPACIVKLTIIVKFQTFRHCLLCFGRSIVIGKRISLADAQLFLVGCRGSSTNTGVFQPSLDLQSSIGELYKDLLKEFPDADDEVSFNRDAMGKVMEAYSSPVFGKWFYLLTREQKMVRRYRFRHRTHLCKENNELSGTEFEWSQQRHRKIEWPITSESCSFRLQDKSGFLTKACTKKRSISRKAVVLCYDQTVGQDICWW